MMTAKLNTRLGAGLLALSVSPLALAAGPAMDATEKQPLNLHAIGMFFVFVLMTLGITYWAASRTKSTAASTLPAAASPASRTASRSRVTTCPRPRCWVSPR